MSELEDPLEILRRIEASGGERVARHLRNLQVTGRIFKMNTQELSAGLTAFRQPPLAFQLWAADNHKLFDEYYGEAIRHFHNFLASAGTLADHVKAFIVRLHSGQTFEAEYRSKVSELFGSSDLAAFVQDLRNYMLHKKIPPTTARLCFEARSGAIKSAVYLNIAALSGWKWSQRSRGFMATITADIDLLEVVKPYEDLVNDFYSWLHERLQRLHDSELTELEDLYQQFESVRER